MPDMTIYRERLEAERARLRDDVQRLTQEVQDSGDSLAPTRGGIGNHLADDASETFEEEKALSLRFNAEQMLEQVNQALQRVADGTYGICANCGKEIPAARLEARPYATLCITCQQKQEGHN